MTRWIEVTRYVSAWWGVVAVVTFSGCAAKHTRLDAGEPDAGAPPDARVDAADADVDAAPPDDCDQRFDALDTQCTTDSDCTVVVQASCFTTERETYSRALGVSRTAVAEFDRLARLCDLPTIEDVAQRCPGEFPELSYVSVQQEATVVGASAVGVETSVPVARCDAGTCVSYWGACLPTQCGNDVRDACFISDTARGQLVSDQPTPNAMGIAEPCDGSDLDNHTCSSLGFGGGTLGCRSDVCLLDITGCRPCAAQDGALSVCRDDATGALWDAARAYALAVSASETGLLWTNWDAPNTLHFKRLDSNLNDLSYTVFDVSVPGAHVYGLNLAAYPSGWVLGVDMVVLDSTGAVSDSSHVGLHVLRADGTYDRQFGTLEHATAARFVVRPDAAPLVIAEHLGTDRGTVAVALAVDLELSAPVTFGTQPAYSATFVGDGYLVASTPVDRAFQIQRIELDGNLLAPPVDHTTLSGDPSLVFDGQAAWMAAIARPWRLMLLQIGTDGSTLGPNAPAIDLTLSAFDPVRLVDWGDGFATVPDSRDRAEVRVLDAAGRLVSTTVVARQPNVRGGSWLLAQGDHLVVGSLGSDYLGRNTLSIARVAP